jgi:hypothetical protein
MEESLKRLEEKIPYKPYFSWVSDYWTARGEPLEFVQHAYLKRIYQDQHSNLVLMKSAQVGATERFLTEALWLPDQFKENSLYFLPTSGTVSDMVQERVDEPINNSEYLKGVSGRVKKLLGKQADKIGLKRMSKGFAYFRGSNNPNQITSISGDVFFADEVDRMIIENVPYFDKRLEHSKRKWQRWGSTPTIPNFGIHRLYLKSDQHEYHVKCNHCGKVQLLSFNDNVDKENEIIICSSCKKQIIPWQLKGEWIARDPSSEIRGYHISQLYSPRLGVKKMIVESEKTSEWEIQQFYNQNLGLPYEPKGSKVTDEDLSACKRDYIAPLKTKESFMGVDVGVYLHVIIRDMNRILCIKKVKDFEELDTLIVDFNCKIIVIDALPETRKAQELARRFKGRTFLCYYTGLKEVKEGEWFKKESEKVNTDRTISLDNSLNEIKKQLIELPKNLDDYLEFKEQLKALVRVISEVKGNKVASYVETGPDHYGHAFNYSNLAKEIFKKKVIPEVMTV